ncbi:MAG: HAD-IA family hydrolase, partial [Oscillospiraceae bacterium]|nr:HAD-IA family hydrolase [Oscillospiraceae bacterium]
KVEHTTGVPLKTGVYEIIRYLRAQRCKLGLASSTRYEIVSMRLKQAGIFDCFDAVVTGDMVCRSKPEPDIFLLCARQMGAVPCNTYVIEDSFNGITAAHRAGMIPIMVPDLKQPDEHIRSLSAAVKDDLLQALEFFKENN